MGHATMAELMRALRLQNPYPNDQPEHAIWIEQFITIGQTGSIG